MSIFCCIGGAGSANWAEEMEAHREMMADRRAQFGSAARLSEDAPEVWSTNAATRRNLPAEAPQLV